MSRLDDRIDAEVRRIEDAVAGSAAFSRVARLKRRHRAIRWTQRVALAGAIVVGSAAGAFALARAFDIDRSTPADDPVVGPTLTPSPGASPGPCPQARDRTYPGERVGRSWTADVLGEGVPSRVSIYGDEKRPARCRYILVVEHTDDRTGTTFLVPIALFDRLPVPPSIFTIAEIDGEPGAEVVVEFGGPGHPHRTGQVYTFEPGRPGGGAVVRMVLEPSETNPAHAIPLYGEFPGAVDCTGEGTIVVTLGDLAQGGTDDSRFDVSRTTYRARDEVFVKTGTESHVVEVGTEDERWPELADDSFRSCPRG